MREDRAVRAADVRRRRAVAVTFLFVMVLRLVPQASGIRFTLGARFHSVHGTMKLREGTVRLDPESGAISGRIVADARSTETGVGRRDRKMHGDVLESERYPEIAFAPASLEGRLPRAGRDEMKVSGRMSIHGVSRLIAVPLEVEVRGDTIVTAGSLVVPYVAWGMNDPSNLLLRVAKEVEVEVRTAWVGEAEGSGR